MPVGEPSELGCELVALARGGCNGHCKAVLEMARNHALEPPDMIDIGNDAFRNLATDRCDQGHSAGRHVDNLARIFAPVRKHVAAEQIDGDPLETPPFFAQR